MREGRVSRNTFLLLKTEQLEFCTCSKFRRQEVSFWSVEGNGNCQTGAKHFLVAAECPGLRVLQGLLAFCWELDAFAQWIPCVAWGILWCVSHWGICQVLTLLRFYKSTLQVISQFFSEWWAKGGIWGLRTNTGRAVHSDISHSHFVKKFWTVLKLCFSLWFIIFYF